MSEKLKKLLLQIGEEKARIAAKAKADERKRIAEVSRLVIRSGIAGLPGDFLERSFVKIKTEFDKAGGA